MSSQSALTSYVPSQINSLKHQKVATDEQKGMEIILRINADTVSLNSL